MNAANRSGRRTFERDAGVLRTLDALFNDAKLRLRQRFGVGGQRALVLLVQRQALSGFEAESDNLGLHSFNSSAQLIVVLDGLQVRHSRPTRLHVVAELLKSLKEVFGRQLIPRQLDLGFEVGELLR